MEKMIQLLIVIIVMINKFLKRHNKKIILFNLLDRKNSQKNSIKPENWIKVNDQNQLNRISSTKNSKDHITNFKIRK